MWRAARACGLCCTMQPRPEKHQIEPMVSGVAVFDYNNDGKPDLYFVNGARQPQLEKTDPSLLQPALPQQRRRHVHGCHAESRGPRRGFRDGRRGGGLRQRRLRPTCSSPGVNRNILYRNRGDGTFEDVTDAARAGAPGPAAKPGPFRPAGSTTTTTACSTCSWSTTGVGPGEGARLHDRQACARIAIRNITTGFPNSCITTTATARSPTCRRAPASPRTSAREWAGFLDFDQDGRLDVFVANDTAPNFLFHNEGGGKFQRGGAGRGRGVQ